MSIEELNERLEADALVVLRTGEWSRMVVELEELERHPTYIAGDLIIMRASRGLAAVEEPNPGERVIRPLRDMDEVRRFVSKRLAQYERMWDGCGCKIDYYASDY